MRLTYRDSTVPHINAKGEWWEAYSDANYNEVINKLAAYEDTGLEPEEIKLNMDGLDDYHKAEAEGWLVILPCKIGDTVYVLYPKCVEPYIQCPRYGGSGLSRCYNCDAFIKEEQFDITMLKYINESIFLTYEEAEIALKGETKAATSESLKEDQA